MSRVDRKAIDRRLARITAKLDRLQATRPGSRWYRPRLRDLRRVAAIANPRPTCTRPGCRNRPRPGRERCRYHGAWRRALLLSDPEFLAVFEDKADKKLLRLEMASWPTSSRH